MLDFLFTRHHSDASGRAELSRATRSGELVRVCEGVYLPAAEWNLLDERGRHLALAHASQQSRRRRLVFSHWTAAAAWDLPLVEPLPRKVHAVALRSTGGRSDDHLVRHCLGIPDRTVELDGLEVTSLARTVVDLARVAPFATAVVAADAGLARLASRDELVAELGPPGARGAGRARRVIEFADARSGSPGESLSRASMATAGVPAPELQQCFTDADGRMFVDFWWPRFGVVGEFDGAVKYDDPAFLAGRTPLQALLDEKAREDRIRSLGPTVTRWRWDVARSPARLRAQLVSAGVRDVRYRKW